jgi:hypothetical protein
MLLADRPRLSLIISPDIQKGRELISTWSGYVKPAAQFKKNETSNNPRAEAKTPTVQCAKATN